ncbi:SUN domain-containing ossification factor-like [Elysia marginata]|uniref:SUN domain-containing ossification factor-like n=1 Tax=Elysia marginata TaxID=1093978 RepID=A0AAV4GWG9_9GAST|nr:SUN domain-containing ossification factor-like [Elysia marginata]
MHHHMTYANQNNRLELKLFPCNLFVACIYRGVVSLCLVCKIYWTDTVPEVVKPSVAGAVVSASVPGDDKSQGPDTESSTNTQPEVNQPQAGGDSGPASPEQGKFVPPPSSTDNAQATASTADTDGHNSDHKVVQPVTASSAASSDTADGGGNEPAVGKEGVETVGSVAGGEGTQGNSDPAHPEIKMDPTSPDLSQVTPSIDPSMIGKGEKPSNLPTGVGGMAVEPAFTTGNQPGQQSRSSSESQGGDVPAAGHQQAGNPDGEEDFPTFDKWSAQYLAEQEKQKIEKEQEQAVKPGIQMSQKKLRQNFAAEGCGAKVVSSNTEAENINFLLNGNPDEYMISPCKAKKWFVVELCEPVQIHKVELGTLELFSSPPKSFRVASSQRFPTKDWALIGQFEMTPDRSVQSFHTQVSEEFVKFLRVEMLEHHGKEHYCPLTTLRVLGIDMALDDDEDSGDADGHDAEHGDSDEGSDGAISLFNTAKETVVKLVKKVLYTGDKEESTEEADNATKVAEEKNSNEQETTPCPIKQANQVKADAPDVTVVSPPSENPEASDKPQDQQQEKPPPATDVDTLTTTETPIITKLADTEQLPLSETPVVVKLEPEEGDIQHPKPSSKRPGHFTRRLTTTCPNSLLHPFFALGGKASGATRSFSPARGEQNERVSKPIVGAGAGQVPERQAPLGKDNVPQRSSDDIIGERGGTAEEPKAEIKQSATGVTAEPTPTNDAVSESVSFDAVSAGATVTTSSFAGGGHTSADALQVQPIDPSAPTLAAAASSALTDQAKLKPSGATTIVSGAASIGQQQQQLVKPVLEPSSVADTSNLGHAAGTLSSATITPTLDIGQPSVLQKNTPDLSEATVLKVDPSPPTDDGVSADHVVSSTQLPPTATSEAPVQDASGETAGRGQTQNLGDDSASSSQTVNVTEPEPVVSQTSQTRQARAPDLVKVGMPTSKRDASVMKLNNRIVALEQNVSMTKKYLEELSRAFKQQNEEMMKLINKTESRMAGLVARYDERDLVQQTAIAVLDQKVANLTRVIDVMQLKMDTMAEELWRGQILLGILQALAFLWLFTNTASSAFTRSPNKHAYTPPASATCSRNNSLYVSPPGLVEPVPEGGKTGGFDGGRQRRNSDGGLQQALLVEDQGMKKLNSESNLLSAASPIQESTKEMFSQNSKKKKKKKQRQSHMLETTGGTTVSSPSLLLSDSAQSTPAQPPSFSSSAGVLFGNTGASVHPSNAQATEPPDDATAKTFATITTPRVTSTLTFGEMKENSPVGDAGLAQAEWPNMHGCRMCGGVLAPRTPQQGLPNPWSLRFPTAGLSPQSLCQARTMCGQMQCPSSVGLPGPPLMSTGMSDVGQLGAGSVSPYQPFLDLSNSLHQAGQLALLQQTSPLRVSEPPQLTASPEFKLPAYRRSKIRRVSESGETDLSTGGLSRSEGSHYQNRRPHAASSVRKTLVVTDSRRRKSDFINPKPWEEFFLAKNYLSENRFKFPSSPPKENLSPEAQALIPSDPLKIEACASSPVVDRVVQNVGTPRAESESSVRADLSDDRADFVSSLRFHPSTPSFIPLQKQVLNSSDDDVFQSSSQSFISSHSNSQREQSSAHSEPSSKSDRDKRRNTLPIGVQQNEQDMPNTNGSSARGAGKLSGGKRPPTAPHRTHRRQGSYPLDQANTARQNSNKSGHPGHASGSSAQTHSSKPDSVSGLGQSGQQSHQLSHGGSKFKKTPSSPLLLGQNRKSPGAKVPVSHGNTCMVTKPRHVVGATAISENPVAVD